nr:hypothetical protein Iba_chr08cCG8810 [Ipomoea batatas]
MKRFTALGPCVHGPPIKATIRAPSVHGPPIKATIRAPAPAIQALSKPEATIKASRVMSRTALGPCVHGPPIKATIRAPSVHGPPIKATIRATFCAWTLPPKSKGSIVHQHQPIQHLAKPEATVKALSCNVKNRLPGPGGGDRGLCGGRRGEDWWED